MQAERPGDDVAAVADSLELLKAFREIRNPEIRRTVITLAQAMRPDAVTGLGDFRLPETSSIAEPPRFPKLGLSTYLMLLMVAVVGASFVVEVLDPAPMDVAASVCHALGHSASTAPTR